MKNVKESTEVLVKEINITETMRNVRIFFVHFNIPNVLFSSKMESKQVPVE